MMKCSLKYVVTTCMLLAVCFKGIGQQEYFIFLQSDQQQQFYVRVGEKIYSSSAAGHLVVSGLKDSTYSIHIGFPKNQYPEMEFVIPVSKKDQGYQLKDMGGQGWNLFNFLTLQLLKPKIAVPKSTAYSPEIKKKTDDYSKLMAGVVNDTAVLYATFAVSAVSDPVASQAIPADKDTGTIKVNNDGAVVSSKNESKVDSPVITGNQTDSENKKKNSEKEKAALTAASTPRDTVMVKTETTTTKAVDSTVNTKETVSVFRDSASRQIPVSVVVAPVSKISEEKTNEGLQLKYVVRGTSGSTDTVNVFIHHSGSEVGSVAPSQGRSDSVSETKKLVPKNTEADNNNTGRLVMINSDCRNFASERDVDKLRIKILSEKRDSEKLEVVRKEYRTKCYTSRQVKALSELFNQDPLRFEFLSASFPFVSDSENFRELVTLFRDPVYVEKFEGLFKN